MQKTSMSHVSPRTLVVLRVILVTPHWKESLLLSSNLLDEEIRHRKGKKLVQVTLPWSLDSKEHGSQNQAPPFYFWSQKKSNLRRG